MTKTLTGLMLAFTMLLASCACEPAFAASQKPIIYSGGHFQGLQSGDSLWDGTRFFGLQIGSWTTGDCLQADATAHGIKDSGSAACGGGAGTVTSVSSANGDITVATGTTTPVLTAVSAPKLDTARSISISGDGTWTVNFDGSANVTAGFTLANTAVTPASYTCTSVTFDAKGRATAASSGSCVASITGGSAVSHQWVYQITSGGAVSLSQPAFTDISGTLGCAQHPALTGDVTTSSCAATIAANAVTNAKAAQMAANTVKGNFTGSTANAADNAMPSCSGANQAINYTSGTGTGCVTITGGGGGGVGTVTTTGSPASPQVAIFSGSTSITGANIAGVPQGRLTLTSGAPVMTADVTAATTIYYDCMNGIAVLYYDGTTDAADNITSCEISTTINSTQEHTSDLFDVFYDHVSAKLCVATNGSGLGWVGDTGGSTTARGTGYSELHNVRGYWTNQASVTHCYNGATDEGPFTADKLTYLGTFYTTAAGQTAMQFRPAAAGGGSNTFVGLFNAYNRVPISSWTSDNVSGLSITSTTPIRFNSSSSDRVTIVDGLGQLNVLTNLLNYGNSSTAWHTGVVQNSTSATPSNDSLYSTNTVQSFTTFEQFVPRIGLEYFQIMTWVASGTATSYSAKMTVTTAD